MFTSSWGFIRYYEPKPTASTSVFKLATVVGRNIYWGATYTGTSYPSALISVVGLDLFSSAYDCHYWVPYGFSGFNNIVGSVGQAVWPATGLAIETGLVV